MSIRSANRKCDLMLADRVSIRSANRKCDLMLADCHWQTAIDLADVRKPHLDPSPALRPKPPLNPAPNPHYQPKPTLQPHPRPTQTLSPHPQTLTPLKPSPHSNTRPTQTLTPLKPSPHSNPRPLGLRASAPVCRWRSTPSVLSFVPSSSPSAAAPRLPSPSPSEAIARSFITSSALRRYLSESTVLSPSVWTCRKPWARKGAWARGRGARAIRVRRWLAAT